MRINPKARVYVVNYQAHDLSDAKRFTAQPFVYVTRGHVPFNNQTTYNMAVSLKDFCEHDFLLISGSAVLAAIAMAILKETNDLENVNVLLYNANTNSYDPGRINGFVDLAESPSAGA